MLLLSFDRIEDDRQETVQKPLLTAGNSNDAPTGGGGGINISRPTKQKAHEREQSLPPP